MREYFWPSQMAFTASAELFEMRWEDFRLKNGFNGKPIWERQNSYFYAINKIICLVIQAGMGFCVSKPRRLHLKTDKYHDWKLLSKHKQAQIKRLLLANMSDTTEKHSKHSFASPVANTHIFGACSDKKIDVIRNGKKSMQQ